MKFVALLSGGKDSCYNIMKCLEYGHELVCTANLHPPLDQNIDEMNSYMYQSAAFNLVPLVAECLGVPLIRHALAGSALVQSLDYEVTPCDEVEDLFVLLKEVKDQYPEVLGVSCGAIVSSYQRYRVENICDRLGLVPLTYLWQRNRKELLEEMISKEFQTILVKVAGAGLTPEKHLGKTLAALYPTITRLHEKYDLDYCGEGGEYESLVLDCPLFKTHSIQVLRTEIICDDEDPTVGNLRIIEAQLVQKDPNSELTISPLRFSAEVPSEIPSLETDQSLPFSRFLPYSSASIPISTPSSLSLDANGYCQTPLFYPNPTALEDSQNSTEVCLQQLRDIFVVLISSIESLGLPNVTISDVMFTHLYLADISHFSAINELYCTYFLQSKYPPSRVCISIPLPPGIFVAMEVVLAANSYNSMILGPKSKRREVLHVKSYSEWAPLCIGPYSQANVLNNSWLFVAGQIGLDPATMKMVNNIAPQRVTEAFPEYLFAEPILLVEPSPIDSLLRNEIYQSILNFSNILLSLESNLLCCLSGVIYISLPFDIQTVSPSSYLFLSEKRTQSILKFARYCLKSIYERARDTIHIVEEPDSGSDEEENLQRGEKATHYFNQIPLLVLFASDLPRNALAEVEFITMGKLLGDISIGDANPRSRSVSLTQHQSEYQSGNSTNISSVELQIREVQSSTKNLFFSLPLWKMSYQPIDTMHYLGEVDQVRSLKFPAHESKLTDLIHFSNDFQVTTQLVHIPTCFSIGYSHLYTPSFGVTSSNMEPLEACYHLMISIFNSLKSSQSKMSLEDLKSIKVYCPKYLCEFRDLHAAAHDAYFLVFGTKQNSPSSSVLQILQTEHIGSHIEKAQGTYLFSAQFIFLNYLQINSELWIAGK